MNSQSNFSIHLVYGLSVFNDCFTYAYVFQSISHIFSGIPHSIMKYLGIHSAVHVVV